MFGHFLWFVSILVFICALIRFWSDLSFALIYQGHRVIFCDLSVVSKYSCSTVKHHNLPVSARLASNNTNAFFTVLDPIPGYQELLFSSSDIGEKPVIPSESQKLIDVGRRWY